MNLNIQKLGPNDLDLFIELIQVFEKVFDMRDFAMPNRDHLQKVLEKPGFMVFVALENGRVVGGLTVYTLDQYYSVKPLAYLYDLAIHTAYQRKGIGKQLITHLTEYCRAHGFEEVFVQADRVDDYALDFYRSTKITNEEDVIHFYYSL